MGVLFDEEDGGASVADFGDDAEDLLDDEGGEAEAWFVEEEQAGFGHHAAGDGDHLELTAGEGPAEGVFEAFEVREEVEHAVGVVFELAAADAFAVAAAQEDVFADGETGEDPAAFGDVGDAESDDGFGFHADEGLACEGQFSGEVGDEAADGAERAAFAGAVAA